MGLQYLDEVRLENLAARLRETYQHLSSDLTAIAALTGQTGFLKKNGAGSWSIDSTSYVSAALLGAANGVAQLGSDQKVLASQLPSYVDDIIDTDIVTGVTPFSSGWLKDHTTGTVITPEAGKIYVVLTSGEYVNRTYRWSGTVYTLISSSLVLGTIAGTAYEGSAGALNRTYITTLQGYFTNGIAKNAARLSNTVAIGSTVMPVYFTAEGKPTPIGYTISRDVAAGEDVTPYTTKAQGGSIKISSHVVEVSMDEYDSPTSLSTGAVIDFIDSVHQNENGTISATKRTIREASASQSGIVSTGAQTFAGNKTINGTLTATGDIQSTGGGVSAHGIADLSVGGGSGVSDYDQLVNKPQINSHILAAGNNSLSNLGIQAEINSSNKLSYSLLSGAPTTLASFTDDATHRLVTDVEKSTWNGKQNAITSSSKLSASLIETSTTLQFVTADQKTEWNNITTIKGYFTNGKANNAINADSATTATTATTATKVGHTLTVGSKTFDGSADVSIVKGDIGLGNVENTALSTWHGTNQITTLGTISTGVWQGTKIADAYINSASEWNKQADWNQTSSSAIDFIKNKPSIVNTFGGKSGAVTVRGGLTANGSVNLAMNGQQLEASIVGLKALAYKDSLAYSEVTDKPTINQTTGTSTTDLMSQKAITDIFAQKDGNYPELVAGNLFGVVNEENAEFFYRPSAGAVNIADGIATFKAMYGKTILWNQLVRNGNFVGGTGWSFNGSSSYSINANVVTFIPNAKYQGITQYLKSAVIGHKYLYCADVYQEELSGAYVNGNAGGDNVIISHGGTGWKRLSHIYTATTADVLRIGVGTTLGENFKEIKAANINIFDLTRMFGAGDEPSSVEEFEALFPLDYYAYNEGQLLSFAGTGIKTTGFNQWDEEWEMGQIDTATGQNISAVQQLRSKNYIPVFPSTNYYSKKGGATYLFACWYDANKNYISYSYIGNTITLSPANAAYMRFYTSGNPAYGTTYNHDICINISHSGTRNGEYEPYEEHLLTLPITTMTGKLNGEGSSVTIFPDGMKSAGSVHDELVRDASGNFVKAIKRIGAVDIGTLNWGGSDWYAAQVSGSKMTNGMTLMWSLSYINAGYIAVESIQDKQYTTREQSSTIYIKDSSYSSPSDFKAAMSGVMLYCELAEPQEYILDEPIPTAYQVFDWGTEQLLPVNDDEPTTTPLNASITYGLNAKDELRLLPFTYVSAKSRQQFTDAEKAIGRLNIGAASTTELTAGLALKQDAITLSSKLSADLIETSTTKQFVSETEKGTWTGKQDAITASNKLSATLIETSTTLQFVSNTEKSTWNNKQDAISPFTTPTASGNALAFVDDISFNGTSFSLTRKNIPAANGTTQAGIVSTGNQSFGGNKEFLGDVKFDGKITVDGDIYLQPEKGLVSEETVSGTAYVRSLFRYDGASAGLRIGYRGNDTLGYGYTKLKLYGTEIDAYANIIGHGYISGTNGVSAGGIADLSTGGGGGGTSDYDQLINKPKINNHELAAGNNTLDTLGIQAKIDANHTIAWSFVQHPDVLDNLVLTPTLVGGEVVGFELEIGDDSVSVGHIADSVIDNLVL